MKKILTLSPAFLILGCASFSTHQVDSRINEKTGEKTTITTKATSRTLFDSKSALSKFRAAQTSESQSATVGSLNQEAAATNAVHLLEAIAEILRSAK